MMPFVRTCGSAAFALCCLAPTGGAFAQALPGAAQVPQAQRRFEPQTPPQRDNAQELPPPVAPTAPPPGAEQVRFVLKDVSFPGMTVYTQEDLKPLYTDLIGREVALSDLYALAEKITARYRRDGYLLALAVVEPQDISDGRISLRVVEGFIDKVEFSGTPPRPERLSRNLAANISGSRPLRARDLERNVLLIGDIPGVNVQSVLRPSSTTFGAADLEIVTQRLPFEGFVSFDNQGSRFLGPYALSAGVSAYDRLGMGEQIDLTGAGDIVDQTMFYFQGALTLPVNRGGPFAGNTIQFAAQYSQSEPDLPEEVFPFHTRSDNFEGRITFFQPIIRSRTDNLSARISLIWRDLENRVTDLPDDIRNPTREHVRMIQPRFTYDVVDGTGAVTMLDVLFNMGLSVLGSSERDDPRLVRVNADGNFFYISGSLARLQPVFGHFAVFGQMDFQWSNDPLPTTERFGVGGPRNGTGYPPGAITGDSGLSVRGELRYGHELSNKWLTGFQIYGRYDYGFASDVTKSPYDWNDLSTIGLGLRLNLLKALSFNPEVSHQLTGDPADCLNCRHDTRFLFNVTQRF
ncbi:hemolysin activation/secretion protein [Novosphingobium sp. PhB165]|uniref:ShlB/FhaC/HecB family hemolysin secretion/activation protein n=1 Tax=Novosphingobium sp. PhB165 TaxID=2485105 RepID=UPI0010486CD2|nr:ShlB/FhaC/HecB family hemolysin secretion/activation protein [Novosphingobium sp. PhB165]TCM14357.1 hemolysin activation/secretion protein [Novosphingobium sp. PhB165]